MTLSIKSWVLYGNVLFTHMLYDCIQKMKFFIINLDNICTTCQNFTIFGLIIKFRSCNEGFGAKKALFTGLRHMILMTEICRIFHHWAGIWLSSKPTALGDADISQFLLMDCDNSL